MADAGHVWRERGETGLIALQELSGQDAGAPPNQIPHYNPPRRSFSTHSTSSSSLAPSHSISQQRHTRSQSPFSPTYSHGSRSASPAPAGTYHSISGGYQHSHPLPALPERNSWHVEDQYQDGPSRRPISSIEQPRRPVSLIDPPRAPALHRRPVSSHDLPALPDEVTFDIPPPHSIGHETNEFIPLGRPVSRSGSGERWEDSSEEEGNYQVVENDTEPRWEEDVDPEILRAVEQMGMVAPVKPKKREVTPEVSRHTPPTPPDTVSSASPPRLPDVRVIEATPQKAKAKRKGKKAKRARQGEQDDTIIAPTPTSTRTAPAPEPALKALPEPILDEPIPRAVSPRPASPAPAPALSAAPRTASPAPRIASPEPVRVASPIRLASPPLVSTSTLSAPAPEPEPGPAPMIQVARAPVPAHELAHLHTPVSPIHDATLGDGDPRGDDVILDTSVPASALISSTTQAPSSQVEAETHSPSPIFETPQLTSGVVPSCQVQDPLDEVAVEARLGLSETPGSLLGSPKPPLPAFDSPRAPSTVFETPRAPPSVFDTPKAVPSSIVHSPVLDSVPLLTVPSAPESVYETPLVIPADIPRVTRYETPKVPQLEIPKSPRLETPRSPKLETPRSPRAEAPQSPQPETPKLPRTGLITPMATGSNPNTHMTASASEPLQDRARTKSTSKRRVVSGDETPGRKKTTKKKGGHLRQSSVVETTRPELRARQPSAEDRADLAAMLRDSDGSSPHVHFPAPGGMFVPSAPPPRPQPGALYLPSNGTTRSDVGPARGQHFEVGPTPGRNRSGSVNGSTSFFGRVAGLFGRKKPSDGYISSSGGQAWRTRTDANISRSLGDDSSEEEPQPKNLVTVTNVNPRLTSVDNHPPESPKRSALGRKLTKADKTQTLRVGPPPESPTRTRKPSITEEQIVPAKSKKSKSRSVDGGGVSRKGSLRSNASDPHGRASSDVGRKAGKEPASLMAIVEGPNLVLPSEYVSRRAESPRSNSPTPARSQTLAVPPARAVSPASTAAPKPVRATSPMPLKSALRNRTPSPLPPANDTPVPQPSLSVPASHVPAQSPRNSISESIYETGEEDFDSATDGEDDRSDVTAAGPSHSASIPAPAPTQPVHSPGAALAAFKDNLQSSTQGAGSVSTAGPRSANSAQRKSVRINPAPPQMSATPTATPGSELDEEPSWTPQNDKPSTTSGGWASRIGRGWDDSSDESIDEEYERVRNALATSSKHMDAMNRPIPSRR
ncbi:unnamed protein product [Rhizoctonia solani]|uniref:Uncharacterized protein n=1 Tax=Rhizoctonia solani TaxID=456999 RepID=A0A8H2XCJ2_9AGAM|nr:unnamed protein product [Rhizoctonia solani]